VTGFVTIRLQDVYWKNALEAILKTYGFGYDIQDNIILVAPLDKLTTLKKMEQDLAQVQPTVTEVFQLKYLDAQDAKKAIEPQISSRGRITILEMTGQAGWEFGGAELGRRRREAGDRMGRSKVLIISDVPPVMDKIKKIIDEIDKKPNQVLIETKIMEVSADFLRDLGVDFGLDYAGAEAATTPATETAGYIETGTDAYGNEIREPLYEIGGRSLGSEVIPSIFGPLTTTITGAEPFNTGLEVVFKRLFGPQSEVIIHALEEDAGTNTLSAPRIVTLDNQEANILIGTRYPIVKSEASTYSSSVLVTSLDYYQDVGIQLNVVPQVGADDTINMVIHPAVTSTSAGSVVATNYPIITTREAETRVLMKDGETILIGGLLRDVKSKTTSGIPFLSKIPILGFLFRRDTYDTGKIDLLVFITAHIIKDNELSSAELARMQEQFSEKLAEKKKKNKK
jgi:type IV pilus assembly protein PilQ